MERRKFADDRDVP